MIEHTLSASFIENKEFDSLKTLGEGSVVQGPFLISI